MFFEIFLEVIKSDFLTQQWEVLWHPIMPISLCLSLRIKSFMPPKLKLVSNILFGFDILRTKFIRSYVPAPKTTVSPYDIIFKNNDWPHPTVFT